LWFSIGSVETFERNLENAQHELGIEPSRSVPVVYKSQTELGTVLSFLPTLLLIGFLIWSMRRAGSMMGGMGAPGRGGRGGGLFGTMMQVGNYITYRYLFFY
jgi:AFG3 family protein